MSKKILPTALRHKVAAHVRKNYSKKWDSELRSKLLTELASADCERERAACKEIADDIANLHMDFYEEWEAQLPLWRKITEWLEKTA